MDTQAAQPEQSRLCSEAEKFSVPGDEEPVIAFCYELVSAGRPFSEILAEAKRRLSLNANPNTGSEREEYVPEPSASTESWQPHWRFEKLLLLAVILTLFLSSVAYSLFSRAHPSTEDTLLQRGRDNGRELSQTLLPILEPATIGDLAQIGQQLQQFHKKGERINLLLSPAADGQETFYFVGSSPVSSIESERQLLISLGILDRLSQICQSQEPFSLIHDPVGIPEIVAVTPITTQVGCWAAVTMFSADAATATGGE